jgi:hypothetical protein
MGGYGALIVAVCALIGALVDLHKRTRILEQRVQILEQRAAFQRRWK